MLGPEILVRTLSKDPDPCAPGRRRRRDRHALVAGWTLLFDLLRDDAGLSLAAAEGRLGIQVDVELYRPVATRFDFALTAVPAWCHGAARGPAFHEWADRLGVVLDDRDQAALRGVEAVPSDPLGARSARVLLVQVLCCVEAAHWQLPRVHGALLSAGVVAGRQPRGPVSAGYVVVGVVDDRADHEMSRSASAADAIFDAQAVVRGLAEGLPAAAEPRAGHDATAVTVVGVSPDRATFRLCDDRRALPDIEAPVHYERALRRLRSAFARRFPIDADVWAAVTPPAAR